MGQNRQITGKVTDAEDGSGVPGATVQVKGTTVATQTDGDGSYTIDASSDQTLVFSFIGYSTLEEAVGNRSVINVALDTDLQALDEVIVAGVAGATSRKKMTVSVTKVGAAQLAEVPATSMSSALSGKVAGFQSAAGSGVPGASVDILLRGDNVLNVSSSPLILMDGIIMTGTLADINVDDVESIEVIKGAAASSLYGSRAGAGVISVTTKRGKSGDFGKPQITLRNEVGFQQLQHTLDVAKSHPYELASDWQQYQGQFTKYAGVNYPAGYSGAGFHPEISGTRFAKADHYLDNPYGVDNNPVGAVFKTGQSMTNYVGISHRTLKNNIFVSFENTKLDGVVKMRDGYNRQNFRVNVDQELTSWLRLSATNLFINRNRQPQSNIFYNISRMEPDVDLFQDNPDGQPYYMPVNQFNGEVQNSLYDLYKPKQKNQSQRWLGSYAANVEFTKWANLDLSQSFEYENYRTETINPKDTYNRALTYTNGGMSQNSYRDVTKNTQATLNLGHKFGDFDVKGKLSYLFENYEYNYHGLSASGFELYGIENFQNFKEINNGTSLKEKEVAQNYFAILGLDWRDKVLVDGMYRYDGSSLFGPESRWNPYYRISGAYRISEDVNINGIDELKVRVAHGTAGIRPRFSWQYEVYSLSKGVASASQKGNEALKPSKTTETEFGLNVDFLKRFTFEAVYAQSLTTDQFLSAPLIPFLNDGFNRQWLNAGSVSSKTFEATLGANWTAKKDFSWNTNFVFTRVRQKITDLPIPPYWLGDVPGIDDLPSGDQTLFRIAENESYGAIYGRRFVHTLDEMSRQLPEGKTIADYEVNSDGFVVPKGSIGTPAEQVTVYQENGEDWMGKIGDGNADFNMGISNTIRWKNFTAYALLDWKQGGDVYNGNDQRLAFNLRSAKMDMTNVPQAEKKAYDYWFLGLYDVNKGNEYWVEDASYLKLREVALGYTIPNSVMGNFLNGAISGVTFKVIGRNLATLTGYSGYDPEVGNLRQPVDGIGANPNFRNIAFSLSFNL